MYKPSVTWGEDIIDSRDINAVFSELMSEFENLLDHYEDAENDLKTFCTKHNINMEGPYEDLEYISVEEWSEGDKIKEELVSLVDNITDCANDVEEFDVEELNIFRHAVEEGESITSEWTHGTALIHEDHFAEYAEELFRDTSSLPKEVDLDSWPFSCIDWEVAANELKQDYSTIEIAKETYYIRST